MCIRDRMDGDSLPVSAFEKYVDGQFEQGASAYEKRGVAVSVPEWDVDVYKRQVLAFKAGKNQEGARA